MDDILHEKEQEGVFFGDFSYLSEGPFTGLFEAKCSSACVNIILQNKKFTEGLAVTVNDEALAQAIDSLHIRDYFGFHNLKDMENLLLLNWTEGQQDLFGSLVALYQVLKAEGLDLLPLTATLHPIVAKAIRQPEDGRGYLYYLENHWMVLRRLGEQWYKFDPWLGGPQLLTHFYTSLYVKQLVADGKLVFLLDGNFPKCPADENVVQIPEPPTQPDEPGKPSVDMTEEELSESLRFLELVFEDEEDSQLALAMLLSLEDDIRRKKEEQNEILQQIPPPLSSPVYHSTPVTQSSSNPLIMIQSRTSNTVNHSSPVNQSSNNPPTSSQSSSSNTQPIEKPPRLQGTYFDSPEETSIIRRKVGTTVNPQTLFFEDLNTSFDSDSENILPSLFNEEKVSRVYNFFPDEPCNLIGSNGASTEQTLSPVQRSTTVCPIIRPTVQPPSQSTTSRVFITTQDTSSFKKVLPSASPKVEEEEETMCCVCWAEIPSHVVVPCGHVCLCAPCSVNISQISDNKTFCPLCKQESSSIIKIYK